MLYFSGGGATIPWVNTKLYDQTRDEKVATGWCPIVLDTNADGKITKPWNEPVGGGRGQNEGGGGGQLWQVRSEARYADQRRQLRHHREPDRPLGVGGGDELSRANHAARHRAEPAGDLHQRALHDPRRQGPDPFRAARHRRRQQRRRSGWRCRAAAASPVSTGASARCSTGRRLSTASSAPKAGRFYPLTVGPNMTGTDACNADFHYYNWVDQFNTIGLRRESADRQPARAPIRCLSSSRRLVSGSRCACRTRSVSTRAVSMAGSTIRTPDGRAGDCGRTTGPTSSGTSRAAKARRARW